MKKIIAVLLSFAMIFSLTACRENNQKEEMVADVTEEKITEDFSEEITEKEDASEKVTEEKETEAESAAEAETEKATSSEDEENEENKPEKTTVNKSENPAEWDREKIADFYKKAARNSEASAISQHGITIKKISINNGQFEEFFDFIMPVMSKLLANNSDDTKGITGGYINLTSSDVASAKAYKSGKNIAIEMTVKEQVSGPRENNQSGSVGHVIDTVGDIGVVVDQLKDLGMPLELSDNDTKIYYTNPTVKVLVDEDGKIINGTWKYTVEIRMDNYKAFGKAVETTSVIMDNVITVGGGFKK